MFTYESKDGQKEVEVTSDLLVTADSELAIFLSRHLQAIHAVVPLTSFLFEKQMGTDPAVFDYVFTPADLLVNPLWQQTMTFHSGGRVRYTFIVTVPGWDLADFALQRPLRDLLVKYVTSHGVTKIEVKWD